MCAHSHHTDGFLRYVYTTSSPRPYALIGIRHRDTMSFGEYYPNDDEVYDWKNAIDAVSSREVI